jgi:hypothetical protein
MQYFKLPLNDIFQINNVPTISIAMLSSLAVENIRLPQVYDFCYKSDCFP